MHYGIARFFFTDKVIKRMSVAARSASYVGVHCSAGCIVRSDFRMVSGYDVAVLGRIFHFVWIVFCGKSLPDDAQGENGEP